MGWGMLMNGNNVVMPQKVVVRTAAAFAGTLILAQIVLMIYLTAGGAEVTAGQRTLVAILTSLIALPIICYSALSAERSRVTIANLRNLAETDTLTGVLNRNGFHAAIEKLERRLAPGRSAGTVLYIDADHFKSINDRFGHHTGDRVLAMIGDTLRRMTRDTDICGRIGGEEFAVLLLWASMDQALAVAERIRESVASSAHQTGERGLSVTVSVGLAVHQAGEPMLTCLQAADLRLYEAKNAGRNRIEHGLRLVRSN